MVQIRGVQSVVRGPNSMYSVYPFVQKKCETNKQKYKNNLI